MQWTVKSLRDLPATELLMFRIEDERHAEPQGEFATLQEAVAELKGRFALG